MNSLKSTIFAFMLQKIWMRSCEYVFELYSIEYATALLLLYSESSGIKYALLIAWSISDNISIIQKFIQNYRTRKSTLLLIISRMCASFEYDEDEFGIKGPYVIIKFKPTVISQQLVEETFLERSKVQLSMSVLSVTRLNELILALRNGQYRFLFAYTACLWID